MPNESDTAATVKLEVQLPPEIESARTKPTPGWTATVDGDTDASHDDGAPTTPTTSTTSTTSIASIVDQDDVDGAGHHSPVGNDGPIGVPRDILIQFLLAVLTLGLYGVYWAYRNHEDIRRHTGTGVGGIVGAILYVVIQLVTLFLLPIEIKRMYERDGRPSPVGAATAFWFVLFMVPWFVRCQAALNDYWEAKALPSARSH